MHTLGLGLLLGLLAQPLWAAELLLILDDLGNNKVLGERALALPAPINLAFLPHTPQAKEQAEQAFKLGHGVMLHAPMESAHHNDLGPGGLHPDMNEQAFKSSLAQSLAAIPHVQGVNNHMGSFLTTQPQPMRWVMETLETEGLFFVDSLTSAQSVGFQTARKAGIPSLRRDVFLDNDTNDQALLMQYQEALKKAKQRGYAVLIGHPYPNTLDFLAKHLPKLPEQGIKLSRVDHFLSARLWQDFSRDQPQLSRYELQ